MYKKTGGHTFEEDDRSNNSDSKTDSSGVNLVKMYAEDRASGSDSRFDQKVGHFATQIRRKTPQNTSGKTYRNGRTECSQDFIYADADRPHTPFD